MIFITLLFIPAIVALGFLIFGKQRITLVEFLIQMGVQIVVALASMGIMYYSNTSDTEVWNGIVTKKDKERVSCSHSYSCNCYTTCSTNSNGTQSCSTHCSTCYEHSHDFDWAYYTTDDGRSEIDRVDRQGVREPPRWSKIVVGEPSSSTHGYTNYIKAAPDTLFRHQGLVEQYTKLLPKYPGRVYDYYRLDRLVTIGVPVPNQKQWNEKLSELNSRLGKTKQANLIVVLINDVPQDYFYALQQHWLGGKKNDTVLVISMKPDGSVLWAEAMAWTDQTEFAIKLRDAVISLGTLDLNQPEKLLETYAAHVQQFYIRKPMKDFEYLSASVTPTTTQWIISMIVGILISIGLGLYMYNNDEMESSRNKWRFR